MRRSAIVAVGLLLAGATGCAIRVGPGPDRAGPGGSDGRPLAARLETPRSRDADGLEELFRRVARDGGVAYLPGGVYRIDRTIRLEQLGPFRIEGEGYGDLFAPERTGFLSKPTRLLWTGPKGGTLLAIDRSIGQSFRDLQLDGGGTAGRLVHLTSAPGWGTGGQRFERVVLRHADTGIEAGAQELDINCDDLVVDQVRFVQLDTGFRTVNHQAVSFHFRSLTVQQVGTMFDFVRGGNLNVDGWAAGSFDLLLRVGYGGPNAGVFRFAGGRPEMNGRTRRRARLAEIEPFDSAEVIFEATQETEGPLDARLPDNSDEPVFRVGPGGSLIVRSHYHARPALRITGGSYRDENGRWAVPPPKLPPERKAGGAAPTIDIVNPRTLRGEPIR